MRSNDFQWNQYMLLNWTVQGSNYCPHSFTDVYFLISLLHTSRTSHQINASIFFYLLYLSVLLELRYLLIGLSNIFPEKHNRSRFLAYEVADMFIYVSDLRYFPSVKTMLWLRMFILCFMSIFQFWYRYEYFFACCSFILFPLKVKIPFHCLFYSPTPYVRYS